MLKGDIVISEYGYGGGVDITAERTHVIGDLSNGEDGQLTLASDSLMFDGDMTLFWKSSTRIDAGYVLLNGNILNPDYDACDFRLTYKQARINGRVVAGRGAHYFFDSPASASDSQLTIADTRAYDTLSSGGSLAQPWDYDAVLAGDFTNANVAEGAAVIDINTSADIVTHDVSQNVYVTSGSLNAPVFSALRANAGGTINLVGDGASYRIFGNVTAGLGINSEHVEGDLTNFLGGRINLGGDNTKVELYGDVFALNSGTVALRLGHGDVFEGQADGYLDQSWKTQTTRDAVFKDHAGETINIVGAGRTELTMGDGSTWLVRGKNLVSEMRSEQGSNIDLTKDAGSSLLIDRFSGTSSLTMRLDADAANSSMLYLGDVAEGSKINLFVDIAEGGTIESLEGVRFATVKTGSISDTTVRIQDQGFFNASFDVHKETYAADDAENALWNGSATGTDVKLGADVVDAFVGDDTAENWLIGKASGMSLSDAGQTVLATARATYWNSVEIDRFNQRYGDRVLDRNAYGVWARVKHEHIGTAAGFGDFNSDNTTYQFGYDYTQPAAGGKWVFGVAVDYMHGDTDYESITGDGGTDRTGFSLYTTYLSENGAYADVVAKVGRLSADYVMTAGESARLKADYDNWMYGLSFEAGHQLSSAAGWFLEPQLQIQFVHVTDGDYDTAQTAIEQDSFNSLIGRAGFRSGKYLADNKCSLTYFKADVFHEWLGEQNIRVYDVTTSESGADASIYNKGTWFDVGAGFQSMLAENLYAYGDVAYRFGNDLDRTWIFNAGARWTF